LADSTGLLLYQIPHVSPLLLAITDQETTREYYKQEQELVFRSFSIVLTDIFFSKIVLYIERGDEVNQYGVRNVEVGQYGNRTRKGLNSVIR
jgi:hypothetical protein